MSPKHHPAAAAAEEVFSHFRGCEKSNTKFLLLVFVHSVKDFLQPFLPNIFAYYQVPISFHEKVYISLNDLMIYNNSLAIQLNVTPSNLDFLKKSQTHDVWNGFEWNYISLLFLRIVTGIRSWICVDFKSLVFMNMWFHCLRIESSVIRSALTLQLHFILYD